jgi:hypothetical protein
MTIVNELKDRIFTIRIDGQRAIVEKRSPHWQGV